MPLPWLARFTGCPPSPRHRYAPRAIELSGAGTCARRFAARRAVSSRHSRVDPHDETRPWVCCVRRRKGGMEMSMRKWIGVGVVAGLLACSAKARQPVPVQQQDFSVQRPAPLSGAETEACEIPTVCPKDIQTGCREDEMICPD